MCDTPQSQNTCRSFSPERAKDYRQGWSAVQPLQETRHNKKAPKGRRKNDVGHWLDGATHHQPKLFSYRNGWCDTPRSSATPLREGMARQRYIDNQIDNQNDAATHPLSERGGRRPGCVAPSSIYKPWCVAPSSIDNLGVSHHQVSTIRGASHHQAKALQYYPLPPRGFMLAAAVLPD